MENEEPPNDIRMVIIAGLFFLCIVAGGVFLALYVLLPTSPPLYAVAGIVLVGVPWIVWLVAYLYSCINMYRNARAKEINAGRVFPKANMSHRTRSTAEGTQLAPAQNSPNGNNCQVQFGGVELLEETSNQEEDDDDGKKDESGARRMDSKGKERSDPT